jgi:CO/xanthine dehydrogenase Mo-binding subunit
MEAPCFVTDIYLPQMLYALTIRSPVAKGRLVSIDCPRLPGNYTLIRAQDIPGKNSLDDASFPVLASEKLSYIGEPVALLVGPNKNTLEDYSRHCKVIAEEGEPVFFAADAGPDQIAARRNIRIGSPETAFAQAASVVRSSYTTGIQEHWYAEPCGAVAWPDETETGELVVRTATQWPFHVRRAIAQVVDISAAKIRVNPTIIGSHMDGKLWYPSLIACHAALGAWITKRPVRLILTREEDFSFSPKRGGTEIDIASALDAQGNITGIEINTAINLGAYAVNANEILDHVNLGSLGVYKTPHIYLSSAAFCTNVPPQGPFAGFGLAAGFFALECHVSYIADNIKQDPAQWRGVNGITAGVLPPGMSVKDSPTIPQLIDTAVKISDYQRKWASYELLRQDRRKQATSDSAENPPQGHSVERHPVLWTENGENLRGIGIALGYQGNGLLYTGSDKGNYSVELILEKDGTLEIKAGMVKDLWIDRASVILGIDREKVRITCGTESPDCGPLVMSRGVTVLTRLVEQACQDIAKKRSRDPLPIRVRKMVRAQKNPAWEENFPHVSDHSGFTRPGWASAIVEVEITPIEYFPRIRGIWMGVDGGKIIAEDLALKSLKDSAVQAIGWAYREQIHYVNGKIPVEQYDNFDIPNPAEIPPITIAFIDSKSTHDEPKGIGDLPFTCIPAAYTQAVSQAMDHHFRSIPLRAVDIWNAGGRDDH